MDPGLLPPELMVSCMCNVALNLLWILTYFGSLLLHFLSDCVQGLSQVKEMLISAVMPIMSVYRLPQGQYGHVINLPQDEAAFAQTLPWLPSQLAARKEGTSQTHCDFRVRRVVVLEHCSGWLHASCN